MLNESAIKELIPDSLRITVENAAMIASNDREIFDLFFDLTMKEQGIWSMRASRVITFASAMNPVLFLNKRSQIIASLPGLKNESVLRNLMKTLIDGELPGDEEALGSMAGFAFRTLESGPMIPGVQVYAMTILERLTEMYPELGDELCLILSDKLDDESAGIRCRAEAIIKRISKKRRTEV